MKLQMRDIRTEVHKGNNPGGAYYSGEVMDMLPKILNEYRGKVQVIYIDPPFFTGQVFSMRMRVGEKEWKSGVGSLSHTAYDDRWSDLGSYLDLMRSVIIGCKELLSDTGVMFLHIDYRAHAHLRLIMDEVFGQNNFLNEIIWTYQTGGRARKYFSRKHDNILFYRKGPNYFFNIEAVPISRQDSRRNHMKKQVDEDGRTFRTIKSGGKIYTYYDDEPAFPGDVWDDVSHLQQRDPQRTGYDTQKPLKLLERIILSTTMQGDLVCDLFAGSGTTLEAASLNGRRFLGVDASPFSLQVTRRRLLDKEFTLHAAPNVGNPSIDASLFMSIGFYEIELTCFELEHALCPKACGRDAIDSWSVGYIRDNSFLPMAHEVRTKQKPQLTFKLEFPVLEGEPCFRVSDVLGRFFYYTMDSMEV